MPLVNHPWRARLRVAQFRGATFHVELGIRGSGRRLVVHEYPKRDLPYAEDMGRRAKTFQITGYILGPDYFIDRDTLMTQLEAFGPGKLVHPSLGELDVAAGPYTVTETRERGGICIFEMTFVEAGRQANFAAVAQTQAAVRNAVDALNTQSNAAFDAKLKDWGVQAP